MCPICGSRVRKFEVNGHWLHIAPLYFETREARERRDPSLVCGDFFASQHPLPVEGRRGGFIRKVREVATIIVPRIKEGKSKILPIILRNRGKSRGIHAYTVTGPCANDLNVYRRVLGIITNNHRRTWRRIWRRWSHDSNKEKEDGEISEQKRFFLFFPFFLFK